MIQDGVLSLKTDSKPVGPSVDEIFGLHLWSYERLYKVVATHGPMMACSDRFNITVKGKGGHGAVPDEANDPLVAAAHLVTMLQTIVSRNISPLEGAVVTVGTIHSGVAYNVIPDSCEVEGTCRAFNDKVHETIISRMSEICKGVELSFGVQVKLDYLRGYPAVINSSEEHAAVVKSVATQTVGKGNVLEKYATMCSEDFSYYLNQIPGNFFFIGCAPDNDYVYAHHNSSFDIHEKALVVGASVMLRIVEQRLM